MRSRIPHDGTHTKLTTIVITPTTDIAIALQHTSMIVTGGYGYHIGHISDQLGVGNICSITNGTHTDLAIVIPAPTIHLAILS